MPDDTFFQEEENTTPEGALPAAPTEETKADPFETSTITLTIRYLPAKEKGGREVVISAQQDGGLGLVDLARSTSYAFLPEAAYQALHKLKARLTEVAVAKQPEVTIQPAKQQPPKASAKKSEATKPLSLFDL